MHAHRDFALTGATRFLSFAIAFLILTSEHRVGGTGLFAAGKSFCHQYGAALAGVHAWTIIAKSRQPLAVTIPILALSRLNDMRYVSFPLLRHAAGEGVVRHVSQVHVGICRNRRCSHDTNLLYQPVRARAWYMLQRSQTS